MGHSQAEKAETHNRIVRIAARRFRENGLDGVGIAELMKEAGLTVGGFYKHFASRDALVAEAVGAAMGTWQARIDAGEMPTFAKLVEGYLGKAHRDNPGTGCAISALAPDIARGDDATKALCTARIEQDIALIAGLLGVGDADTRRAGAILSFSALVGAITIARAVSDEELSEEILTTVSDGLKGLSGQAPTATP